MENIVFSKDWFKEHQRFLVFFASTKLGKKTLGIDLNFKVDAILPNAIFTINQDNTVTAVFRVKDEYAQRLYHSYKLLWDVLHFLDIHFINRINYKYNFGFDTLTAYPAAGSNSPVDGSIVRQVETEETLADIRSNTGTTANDINVFDYLYIQSGSTTDFYTGLQRAIFCFDTSALTSGATISAASLSLASDAVDFGVSKMNFFDADPDIHIAGATPASTSTLATSDYNQCQTTSFGSVSYASWSDTDSVYNDVTLNASGISNINKTGISKFSGQLSWDINNAVTATWAASNQVLILFYMADNTTGTSISPKLVVTYTVSSPTTKNGMLLGVFN